MKKKYLFCFLFLLVFAGFSFSFAMRGNWQGMGNIPGAHDFQSEAGRPPVSDILSQLPTPQISINPGEKISGERKVYIKIPELPGIEIEKVEIYLRQPPSLTEIYVGQVEKKNGLFEFNLNTEKFPNGQYFLFLKIISSLGEYKSQEILFEIENKIEEKKEEIERVKEEVGMALPNLEEKEKEAKEIVEKASSQIEEALTMEVPEVKEEMAKVVKEEVEPKIKEMKEKVEKEVVAREEEIPKIQREKETLKKEIVEKNSSTNREKDCFSSSRKKRKN